MPHLNGATVIGNTYWWDTELMPNGLYDIIGGDRLIYVPQDNSTFEIVNTYDIVGGASMDVNINGLSASILIITRLQ